MAKISLMEVIEDSIIEILEDSPWLPNEFEVCIDSESFRELKTEAEGVRNMLGEAGPTISDEEIVLKIQGHSVAVRHTERAGNLDAIN